MGGDVLADQTLFERFHNKRCAVIGLGKSNLAVIAFLFAHGAQVVARDAKERDALRASLGEILELLDTTDVHVCGIATEFCVRNTCEDLLKAGFRVHLLKDCIAYVSHEGHLKALEEMASQGIVIE